MAVFAEHIVYKRQQETHQSRSVKDSLGEGGHAGRNYGTTDDLREGSMMRMQRGTT